MPKLPITPTKVEGAWLVYRIEGAEKDTELPLTKFQVKFALNKIPTASVIPAIGFNLRKPSEITTLVGLKENMQVKVLFSSNNEQVLLMEGFVQTITVTEKATAFNRKASALVVVKHNIVRLAGAPPSSFSYITEHETALQTLYFNRKSQLMISPPGDQDPPDLYPQSAFIRQVTDNIGVNAGWYPSLLLEYISDSIADEWKLKEGMDSPDDLIRSYDPANVLNLDIANVPILQRLSSTFSQNFPNSNTWESLVRTAKMFFLDIVPFNRGVYISNTYAMLREPDISITAGEYVNITDKESMSNAEPVNAIAVLNPMLRVQTGSTGSVLATWPKVEGKLVVQGRYYHFREFPAWLASLVDGKYGSTNENPVNEQTPGTSETDNKPTKDPQTYLDLAERIAQSFYAKASMSKKGVGIVLPFRTDLMPGTVIKVQKPEQRQDFFVSDDIHGHITETTFDGDLMSNQGSLTTSITVRSARTAEDNNSEETPITVDEHPLYQARWVHIDIDGEFLAPLPEHDPRPTPVTKQTSATTGKTTSTE